jgi:hypothetical protein
LVPAEWVAASVEPSSVADPNLYGLYASGVVEGAGTEAPQPGWHDVTFLTPIIESIQQ